MRLGELGEFGLLAELEQRALAVGIDHDAAEFDDGFVVTQDALIESVHFRLDWTSWRDLGYKAAAVNLSDLAASGANPLGLAVTLGAPAATKVEEILELYEGLNEPGVPVIGGDTTNAERLYLSVTAVGRSERVPGRAGAQPGDRLVVTGPLGASAAGFLCLQQGIASPLVKAHTRPPLRLDQGRTLAAHAHALLDISDGLVADAAHIAERSGCRCVIELELVPVAAGVAEIATRLGRDVDELSCGFGEDYELLAAVEDPRGLTVVGRCELGEGVEVVRAGEPIRLSGWEHFARL
jgi:thiamine-monophosphate kinase